MARVVAVSDTHNNGPRMELPDGDILVHAGDHTQDGSYLECERALRWLGSQPHAVKLLIPGNHDMLAAKDPEAWDYLCRKYELVDLNTQVVQGWQGAAASPASEYATRVSDRFGAFQYLRTFCSGYWRGCVMDGLLALVTHGPPEGIGDLSDGVRFGCPGLRDALNHHMDPPKLHLFGHNHEQPGHWQHGRTLHCNVSTNHGNGSATVLDLTDGQWTFVSGPGDE